MAIQTYEDFSNIKLLDLQKKSILIIGGGYIANEYATALSKLKVKNVTILGKSKKKMEKFKRFSHYEIIDGGYEKKLSKITTKDLVIIATPIPKLIETTKKVIECGHKTILIEKPGSVFKKDLIELKKIMKNKKIRIAYNRLFYPSFHKLKHLTEKEGGVTSCKFDITEWLHTIKISQYDKEVCKRWGISNSLHVISMAFELIGMPKKMISYQNGGIEWHPTGSIFVGSGISEKNIPFSYHANWKGGGRWGIEIVTRNNIYRLIPLEKLFVSKKGSTEWREIPIKPIFPNVKEGIAEEIITMLNPKLERKIGMITIDRGIEYIKIAEKIFGYRD